MHAAGRAHGRLTPDDVVEIGGVLKVRGAGLLSDLEPDPARTYFRHYTRYLAPEIKSGDRGTRMSDVYSLGAILVGAAIGTDSTDLQGATARAGQSAS